jgi:hypothetical protein
MLLVAIGRSSYRLVVGQASISTIGACPLLKVLIYLGLARYFFGHSFA